MCRTVLTDGSHSEEKAGDKTPAFFHTKILLKPEPASAQGICVRCLVEPQSYKGNGKFRALCLSCHKKRYPRTAEYVRNYMRLRRKNEGYLENEYQKRQKVGYKAFKKDHCEKCGFVAKHLCQLDVDHIDGDSANDDPTNLQTLCANCHRLKTYLNKDFKKKKAIAVTVFTVSHECDMMTDQGVDKTPLQEKT